VSHNPFPGPQPYRASDRDRFFGREDLSYRLCGSILANRCVTVFGPSGAGKSSLVQASVIPELLESQDVRVVRVDAWPDGEAPTAWLVAAAYESLGLGEPPEGVAPAEALIAAAQRAARRSPRLVLVYLDQIEQLLYAGRDGAASAAFFEAVSALVDLPLRNLRVVMSLREDYLGRFRDRLRDHHRILGHGMRVGPLTVAELCGAVCKAAAAGDPPQKWDEAETRELMFQVRVPGQAASGEAEAQAAYAQIVCRALFQRRAEGGGGAIEAEDILRRYLEATLRDLGDLRGAAERLLEDHLVTADGSRTLRTEKELSRDLPAASLAPVLAALERAAILHAEEHQGSRYFEIGHDWLARRVHEGRELREREEAQRRREEEVAKALAEERAEAEAKLAKARRQRRTLGAVAIAAVAIAAGATALGAWALRQKSAADEARRAAEQAQALADAKRVEASDERIIAAACELVARGHQDWAMKLLPAVQRPGERRRWIGLASEAIQTNALRVSLRGHEGPLTVAAWSPGGDRVLTASVDGTARVWKADGSGAPLVLEGHAGPVLAAAWSPDGKRALTGHDDGTARIWDLDGKEPRATELKGHEDAVVSVAWSPDGARVLTASADRTARVWSADGKEKAPEIAVLRGHKGPLTIAVFHPDGARVLTAADDGAVMLWDGDASGKHVTLPGGHAKGVLFLAVSPDGTRFVTTSRDRTARVWDASGKGSPVVLAGHEGSVLFAAWSPDGASIATASADRTARIFHADGQGQPIVLSGHALSVTGVAWSPDGKYLATASADRTARIWLAEKGTMLLPLIGHDAPVRSIAWVRRAGAGAGAGGAAAGGAGAGGAGAGGAGAGSAGGAAAAGRDDAAVLTAASDLRGGSTDFSAKIWSTAPIASLTPSRGGAFFHSASLTPDGSRMVVAYDDSTAALARVDGEGEPAVLRGHTGWIANAAPSPDGTRVATASFDKTARVWSADGKGDPVVLRGHEAEVRGVAWSPDGKRVATVSNDRTARVWSADGKGDPVVLRGHEDWVSSAAWTPDGARIVTTSLDRTARVWSADGKGDPVVLAGHGGEVYAAAVSPDGKRVVTVSEDRFDQHVGLDGLHERGAPRAHGHAAARREGARRGRRGRAESAPRERGDLRLRHRTVVSGAPHVRRPPRPRGREAALRQGARDGRLCQGERRGLRSSLRQLAPCHAAPRGPLRRRRRAPRRRQGARGRRLHGRARLQPRERGALRPPAKRVDEGSRHERAARRADPLAAAGRKGPLGRRRGLDVGQDGRRDRGGLRSSPEYVGPREPDGRLHVRRARDAAPEWPALRDGRSRQERPLDHADLRSRHRRLDARSGHDLGALSAHLDPAPGRPGHRDRRARLHGAWTGDLAHRGRGDLRPHRHGLDLRRGHAHGPHAPRGLAAGRRQGARDRRKRPHGRGAVGRGDLRRHRRLVEPRRAHEQRPRRSHLDRPVRRQGARGRRRGRPRNLRSERRHMDPDSRSRHPSISARRAGAADGPRARRGRRGARRKASRERGGLRPGPRRVAADWLHEGRARRRRRGALARRKGPRLRRLVREQHLRGDRGDLRRRVGHLVLHGRHEERPPGALDAHDAGRPGLGVRRPGDGLDPPDGRRRDRVL
jgi:WD40 repeat protein